MYFDKIDDLIDKVIDDFNTTFIQKNKLLDQIKNETNFVKYQKDINDMVMSYLATIPKNSIEEITKKGDSINQILQTIARYVVMYLFLTIGFFYKSRSDIFINNIIEFSKNQPQYQIKLENFFNSDSNGQIIRFFYWCKNVQSIVSKPAGSKTDNGAKSQGGKKEPYIEETTAFLDELGEELIDKAFRLKSLNNDLNDQSHNIIKTIILLMIYRNNDKKILHNMIEQSEIAEGEYMFIDVIEPQTNTISFDVIESILSQKDAMSGMAYDIWDYLEEVDKTKNIIITAEEKINILINAGILIPILDDFMLYHKESEKYDKTIGTELVKKKEDTKIRYIIGKIDATAELYSNITKNDPKIKGNIMKNFYPHLYPRKAVLRNEFEEIKIINKYLNQGKRNSEINDYFNDLIYYRRYPYVNFKDFEKYGFTNHFTETVTSARAVNFEKSGDFKQTPHQRLQIRVGAKDSVGNVVGFIIPTNTKPIHCLKVEDFINIRDLSKTQKNGFELFLNFLRRSKIKGDMHKSSVYWLFDMELDSVKLKTVESTERQSVQENVKNMLSELYDRFVRQMYIEIINKIDSYAADTINMARQTIRLIESNVGIPIPADVRDDVEKYFFEKKLAEQKIQPINDEEYGLFGLEGSIIDLPTYKPIDNEKVSRLVINTSRVDEQGVVIEIEKINGVCQHNISWDQINDLRKVNNAEYMKKLYMFIQQYVVENAHHEYICKSCGFYLDIKKYIADGTFDDESQRFITFSMPMEANLEDLPEYEKYNFAIKIMDKNIEKIASSVGIPYFVGNTQTVKWRRKGIIKNTIDMVTANNLMMSKRFKERNENKSRLYGISKGVSNLFIFEMENNIFQSSSKDKDQEQFKMIKKNNIMVYIMIYLILELNESQISFFISDKKNLCDIKIFDTVYQNLFGGLRIKKNSTSDTVEIIRYKMLCYLIYMISCRIAKHRLWYSVQSTEKNIQKMIPIIQKFIVHTCVDCLNSILENSFEPGVGYIFEVFRVRFYTNLKNFYVNDNLYKILLEQGSIVTHNVRRREGLKLVPDTLIPPYQYNTPAWRTVLPNRFFLPIENIKSIDFHGLSNLTNCDTGDFHMWKPVKGDYVCTICNTSMRSMKYDEQKSKKIHDLYLDKNLNILALKFCQVDGLLHLYVYNEEKKANICTKCGKRDNWVYSHDELKHIEKKIDEIKDLSVVRYKELQASYSNSEQESIKYVERVVEQVKKKMQETIGGKSKGDNTFNYLTNINHIDLFIDELRAIVGTDIKGVDQINLKENIYIIDHDYMGYDLGGKNIQISDSDKKIIYKANHPHFKTDTIYYTDMTKGRIDVFYDARNNRLLGYKEASKDYVDLPQTNKRIKINYSIYNKLKFMGYSGEYISIIDEYPDLIEQYDLHPEKDRIMMQKEIVIDICRKRHENLKKMIMDFIRTFNRILNGFSTEKANKQDNISIGTKPSEQKSEQRQDQFYVDMSSYFSDKLNKIIEKYKKKLQTINIESDSGKHRVFKHWKGIVRGIYINEISNFSDKQFNFDSNLYHADTINGYDTDGNLILFYIVDEFRSLLKMNNVAYAKSNIAYFLIEFIDRIFFQFNTDNLYTDRDIRKFIHVLRSIGFMREISESTVKTEGVYGEVVEDDQPLTEEDIENQIDLEEEMEAMDVDDADMEEGFESTFDKQTEWEPDVNHELMG